MSEWREFRLDEVADIVDCEHKTAPIVENSEFYSIRTSNISNGKIDFYSSNRVSFETYQEWTKRAIPKEGDIILAREAPVGEVGMVKKGYKVCLGQRTVLLRVNNEKVDNWYLLYYLVNPVIKFELTSRSTGSVVSHLNMKDIRAFEVSLPPLPEQKAIAGVLSSLDDKIDLLHRQNKTLEQMAEALFRQWFIEEASEDWVEYSISDFAEHIKINVVPSKNVDTSFFHYSLPAFDSGQTPTIGLGSEILSNKYKVLENSILISKLNPRFPRIWAIGSLNNQFAICSTEFQVLKLKDEKLFGYLYFLLRSDDVTEELTMAASGTSGSHQRVKPEDIFNIKTLLPSLSQAEKFSYQILPNIKKVEMNRGQIQTLEKLRDNLLPKLMSGELRVK